MSDEQEVASGKVDGDGADYEYAKHLTDARHQAFRDLDKLLVTLSSGTLALSLTFLTDALPSPKPGTQGLLIAAWALLALSLTAVLLSLAASTKSLTKALVDHCAGSVNPKNPGGVWQVLTRRLNYAGILLFLAGVSMILVFAAMNLEVGG